MSVLIEKHRIVILGLLLLSIASVAIFSTLVLSGGTNTDPILSIHNDSLTTYLHTSATNVQDVRSLVGQRGVNLDGSLQSPTAFQMAISGNPFEGRQVAGLPSSRLGNVRLATGTYEISDVDLSLPAPGFPWVVGRSYNACQQVSGSEHTSDGYQGKNWFQNSQPEICWHLYISYGE